ncbi:hypothetical protein D9M69_578460 [compost metagenome]
MRMRVSRARPMARAGNKASGWKQQPRKTHLPRSATQGGRQLGLQMGQDHHVNVALAQTKYSQALQQPIRLWLAAAASWQWRQ